MRKNIFDKMVDFYNDYESMINLIVFTICLFCLCLVFTFNYDKQLTIEKNIIENTKSYEIFNNCKNFDNKYYCWNEN